MQKNLNETTFDECLMNMHKLIEEARKKIRDACNKAGLSCTAKEKGRGINTAQNDRRLFSWITIESEGECYLIDLFYNDIDPNTGNFHSQIGRLCFVNGMIGKNSPNEIISNHKDNPITINYYKDKWQDPIKYFKITQDEQGTQDELRQKWCSNHKWLTVNDVLSNKDLPDLIADAMKEFIKGNTAQSPPNGFAHVLLASFPSSCTTFA